MKLNPLLLPLAVLLFLVSTRLPEPQPPADSHPTTLPLSKGIDQDLRIPVGIADSTTQPPAQLAIWIIEPAAGTPLRGTVIFLHGFETNHRTVSNAGEALRKHGYRAVLVDMRGFGQSTGTHADFGVTNARDLSQLVDALQAKDLCGPTLGVYGTSLGAATAILFAGQEPRVVSVVAVAPFADIRDEVPSFTRGVLTNLGAGKITDLLADEKLNTLGTLVGKLANWNLESARPLDAIRKTKAPVLLIHGDADDFIPHAASEQLHAAALDHSQLVSPHNRNHLDLCFDLRGELQGFTRDWFDKTLMPR